MKSIDDINLQEKAATHDKIGQEEIGQEKEISQEEETVTAETQLQEKDMDSVSKKSQNYSPNKRVKYGYIKYVSLAILTIQNAALGLSMRYSRTRQVEMFAPTAAVVVAEVLKLAICFVLVMKESGGLQSGLRTMYTTVILNIKDTLRVCVPSFLYVIQNNLLYVSVSNLDAATYQITYQLKILTTAFFAVLVLKRRLKKWQWGALALLVAGVILVQLTPSGENETKPSENLGKQSKLLGFGAALAACFISGFAGIYFEKVLKESDISVWMRNVQLSLASIPFGIITHVIKTGTITDLMKGFDGYVWYLVALNAAGGLLVAVVVKYADNILKGFATSVAIIISCVASIYIFDFHITIQFAAGAVLVIGSIFLYGYVPKKPETRTSLSV
ncbi:UDP-N-acetylglucosamine transporter isoform X1 [Bicyclus anynana]|uniref:UDP-N-acetylglucosamine transporter isoform X1 n=2 Tax=Bicyclus anynana TaxID=110368 RepID=A0A6J1NNM2_BICAN|nr:UDP-N-acetylglucosamine transporter isoform X1 [Bicyclus anynana]